MSLPHSGIACNPGVSRLFAGPSPAPRRSAVGLVRLRQACHHGRASEGLVPAPAREAKVERTQGVLAGLLLPKVSRTEVFAATVGLADDALAPPVEVQPIATTSSDHDDLLLGRLEPGERDRHEADRLERRLGESGCDLERAQSPPGAVKRSPLHDHGGESILGNAGRYHVIERRHSGRERT